jgi:hypothetical protein
VSHRVENMKVDWPMAVSQCPMGMRCYVSKAKAKHFASSVGKSTGTAHRVYRCRRCRTWHLTTMTAGEIASFKDSGRRHTLTDIGEA